MIRSLKKLLGVPPQDGESALGHAPQGAKAPHTPTRFIHAEHVMHTTLMGSVLVVTLIEPHLDADRTYAVSEEVRSILARDTGIRDLVFDTSNVKHLDSTGLGMLVDLLGALKPRGGRIAVAAPAQQVQVLFKLTRLELVFLIRREVLECLDALTSNAKAA